MGPALTLALVLAAAAADLDLHAAEQAYEQARYRQVLPSLDRALAHPLTSTELLRAYELQAMTQAAFGDSAAALTAFRRALGVDGGFLPEVAASPKVRALFEEAKRLGPLAPLPLPAPREPVTPRVVVAPPEPARPLVTRWWFWGSVGVLVAGGAAASVYAVSHRVPPGTLGTGSLQ